MTPSPSASERRDGRHGDGGTETVPSPPGLPARQRLSRLLTRAWPPVAAPMPNEGRDFGKSSRDAYYRRALGVSDVVSAMLAVTVTLEYLGDDHLHPATLLVFPLVVLMSKLTGLYDRDELLLRKTTLDEVPALFQLATLYTLVIWLGEELVMQGHLGKPQVLGLWGLLFVSMTLGRALARRLVRPLVPPETCLVLGDELGAGRVLTKLHGTQGVSASVVGRVPLEPEPTSHKGSVVPVLGDMDGLGVVLAELEIDRVVIAPGSTHQDTLLDAIRLVKTLGVKVSVLPRLFEVVGSSVEFDNVDGVTLLGVRRFGLSKSSQLVKRSMDLVVAGLGLISLAPVLALVAAAVKLTSAGPVLFRQSRIGRDGREFDILKFRTMVADAESRRPELEVLNEAQGIFKITADPRTTPLGSWLRETCVDELPQLWNVIRGEMSLVGPRPLIRVEDERVEGWNRRRLQMTPGMTGFWQVSGSARILLHEMVTIDYLYGANWSLWGDVKILLRTVPYVLARRGL